MNKLSIKQIGASMVVVLMVMFATATGADSTMVQLKGKAFEYAVGDYHLRITFEDETRLRWEYLKAPDGLTGKTATENIDRRDLRPDLILMAWDEQDGTHVVDILDLKTMRLYANFVTPDNQRFFVDASVNPVE